jgi:hypothetical protein
MGNSRRSQSAPNGFEQAARPRSFTPQNQPSYAELYLLGSSWNMGKSSLEHKQTFFNSPHGKSNLCHK